MTRQILIAGLLGGLLGGVVSFAASRWIVPAKPEAAGVQPPTNPEARAVAEAFVDKLRAGKFEEFALHAKLGSTIANDEQFTAFRARLMDSRTRFTKELGPSSGEFEFLRETSLSPSLARYVYLEKFQKGAIPWIFVLYYSPDSLWRVAWVDYGEHLGAIFAGLS